MIPVTQNLLDQMVRAIVDEVEPEQVILFGSRARGDARSDSDVDLIVVESESFSEGDPPTVRRFVSGMCWGGLTWPRTCWSTAMTTSRTGGIR